MDKKQLKEIIKMMRTNGVIELKFEGIELKLSPESIFPKDKFEPDQTSLKDIKTKRQYTDLEMMLWSSADTETPIEDREDIQEQ